jgi:beta-glucanase (GH16 family)
MCRRTLLTVTLLAASIFVLVAGASSAAAATPQPRGDPGNWTLAFDDEFSGTSLDTSNWAATTSGYNNNNMNPSPADVKVSGGDLKLRLSTAGTSSTLGVGGMVTTSATAGASPGFAFDVGDFVQARIDFPGPGTGPGASIYNWPMFWTSGPSWPAAGESDIFDGLGTATSNYIYDQAETAGGTPLAIDSGTIPGDWSNGWHTYGLYRGPSSVTVYFDGEPVTTYATHDDGAPQSILLAAGSSNGTDENVGSPSATGTASVISVSNVRVWAPTGSTSPEQPSGEAMPTGNIPGWTYTAGDDFSGSSLNTSLWGNTYYGQPGGDPGGWWNPSHIVVGGGEVALKGYQDPNSGAPSLATWTTAGMKATGLPQTYGKYEVRAKMDNGVGIGPVFMLWPANNSWPPEIDFAENNASNPRSIAYGTLHYGSGNTQIGNQVNVDWSQWHTYGVEWTPGQVVYTLDGNVWATVDNVNVPSIPMDLVMQTGENGPSSCGGWEQCTNATTPAEVDLDVDWIVAYSPG